MEKTISFSILEDSLPEDDEEFTILLSGPGGGAILGETNQSRYHACTHVIAHTYSPQSSSAMTANVLKFFTSSTPCCQHVPVPLVCAAIVTIEANDEAYGVFSFAATPLNATLEEAGSITSEANSKPGVGSDTK